MGFLNFYHHCAQHWVEIDEGILPGLCLVCHEEIMPYKVEDEHGEDVLKEPPE